MCLGKSGTVSHVGESAPELLCLQTGSLPMSSVTPELEESLALQKKHN